MREISVTSRMAKWVWGAGSMAALIVAASSAGAQDQCSFLCAPDFKVEPTLLLAGGFLLTAPASVSGPSPAVEVAAP